MFDLPAQNIFQKILIYQYRILEPHIFIITQKLKNIYSV